MDDLELCPRFTGRVLTGVRVGESPAWLARRLVAAGMRPINNVVDASNYVMLELGQPTHPYDLDRLAGGGLLVRRAGAGETVTTLDGVERTLGRPGPGLGDTGQDCLICDATGAPVGIGGIMGGASSEIGSGTTRVLLEAAYFVPMAIARTSKRLNLRTEASARFERGCDPAGIDRAAERFCELLALTGGPDLALAGGVLDVVGPGVPVPLEVTVRPSRVNGLLGTGLGATDIAGLLEPLGMEAVPTGDDDDPITVVVPTFRPDIRPAAHGRGRPGRGGGPHLRLLPAAAPASRLAPARPPDPVPAGAPEAQGRAVRTRRLRGVDHRVRHRGRPGGGRFPAPVHRGGQPPRRRRAVPAVVDGPRAGARPRLQRRAPSG